MNRALRRYIIAMLGLVAATATGSPRSYAQSPASPARIAAQGLYEQAEVAMKARDFAGACPKLEEVVRLVPEGVGAKLMLAACYEADGRLASAWSTYLLAEATAVEVQRPDRQKLARERADALQPQLARLQIAVANGVQGLSGLVITCDGVSIARTQWGEPIPVDRGQHVITARADGRSSWEARVDAATDGATVRVDVDEMPEMPAARAPEEQTAAKRAPALAPARRRQAATGPWVADGGPFAGSWGPQRTTGAVAAIAGMAGLGVGIVAGSVAIAQRDASNSSGHCGEANQCDAEGTALRAASLDAGNVASAAFVGGALSLAGGITLFLAAPDLGRPGAQVTVGLQRLELHATW
jgi:hypothetical protein